MFVRLRHADFRQRIADIANRAGKTDLVGKVRHPHLETVFRVLPSRLSLLHPSYSIITHVQQRLLRLAGQNHGFLKRRLRVHTLQLKLFRLLRYIRHREAQSVKAHLGHIGKRQYDLLHIPVERAGDRPQPHDLIGIVGQAQRNELRRIRH